MNALLIIFFVLFVVGLVLVAGWRMLADAIRGLGEEPEPSGRPDVTTEERKNAKIREELARLRAGDETASAQQRMADRKIEWEIQQWREGK